MDIFSLLGLGIGVAFAFMLPKILTLDGNDPGSGVTNQPDQKRTRESRSSAATGFDSSDPNERTDSTIHRSTQLLTDEESEEAAEALRSALGKRR